MTISKREKTLIIIVLLLAVLCMYYMFFLKPYMDEMNTLSTDMSSKEISVNTNEQIKSKLGNLEEDISEMESQIESYSGVTYGFDQPSVLRYLADTINEYASKIMFRFEDITQIGQLQVCNVTATMNGTYDGLKNVLKSINEGKYFIKVSGLTASQKIVEEVETSQNGDEGSVAEPVETSPDFLLDITINLEVYSFPGAAPLDAEYPETGPLYYGGDIFY